ncbi:MAG: 3-carboxymuconate cyclase [Acidobacteriota bacterium]|nr:MAG: 3-carboxymuconate cyclase [Acidobacteriota bacterium]
MHGNILSFLFLSFAVAVISISVSAAGGVVGAVYTMTNAPAGNEVLVFDRLADGSVRFSGAYDTGGLGSGDGLGNQGGVVLSRNKRWLLAVNAGSNELSVFEVRREGIVLTDVAGSGGVRPVSVAIQGDLVYVAHAGGSVGSTDSVSGFRLDNKGRLLSLAGSSSPLSAPATGPAQVGFSPDGRFLLVTEKATSRIDVFPVDTSGYLGTPVVNSSTGQTPFAFDFGPRDQLFVSEVFGGANDAGAVSSYSLAGDGQLFVIDGSVANTETAPCWLVVTEGSRYAFTTNTPDDSLSAYAIDFDGKLELVDADGRTGEPGPGTRPLDMDLSDDGRFLYTLNIGEGSISTFRVLPDGALEHLFAEGGVPSGVNGLAAR